MPLSRFRPEQYRFNVHLAVCLAAGALSAFAMPPFNLFPLLFAGMSILYIAVYYASSAPRAFVLGWAFSFAYFVVGLFWVRNALLVDGNPYAWVWPLAVCGLPALLAFFAAFACFMAKHFSDLKTPSGFFAYAAFAAFFEYGRGHAFTGFPWNLYGHTWSGIPQVLQVMSFSDAYGLTLLTALWCAAPGFLFVSNVRNQNKKLLVLFLALLFVFSFSFGYWRLQQPLPPNREDVKVHLVQANIPQSEKWKQENMWDHFIRHIELSRPSSFAPDGTVYIIWSETALSQWVLDDPKALPLIQETLALYKGPSYLITGFLRYEAETGRFFNSLIVIDKAGRISNIYDKNHLVPFGEYIPFQNWIPLEPVARFRGFAGGSGLQTYRMPEGLKYSPMICYEIIFANAVADRGDKPDFILNVTNDSWYGDTAGPRQHLQQAAYRAIEEGIPVIRVADTGISAVIDPYGHIIEKSGLFMKYEKTLALPRPVVVSKANNINEVIFLILLFCMTSSGFFTKRKN
jgi:apolipoprotein N-acyltransferase